MNARRLVTLAALAWAASSLDVRAAEIVDLRVGQHREFTRVVFELDESTSYQVQWQAGTRGQSELVVTLDASCSTRILSSRSALVESVQLEPRPEGSIAFIRLKASQARMGEMILQNPPRIVFDLHDANKPARDAEQPSEDASPAEEVAPEEDAGEATPFAGVEITPHVPAAVPVPESEPGSDLPEPVLESPEPIAGLEVPEVPAAESEVPEESESDLSRALSEPAPEAPPAAPESAPIEEEIPPVSSAITGDGDGGPGLKTGLGIAALVFALAFLWVGIRRRAQNRPAEAFRTIPEREPHSSPFEPSEREPAEPAALKTEELQEAEIEPEPALAEEDSEQPPAVVAQRENSHAETPAEKSTAPETAPGLEHTVTTLENRVEELTRRLERAGETRDRLQRQLESHTEELRVQRSALARTQRVVRSLMRADPPTPPESS